MILDTRTNETWPMGHMMVPNLSGDVEVDVEDAIVRAVEGKP